VRDRLGVWIEQDAKWRDALDMLSGRPEHEGLGGEVLLKNFRGIRPPEFLPPTHGEP
jgi:hypothetical protein